MTKDWAPIEDFPMYEVHPDGVVRSKRTSDILRPTYNQHGNAKLNLTKNGEQFTKSLSHLVANAHLEPPKREDFTTLIHLDGDRSNCRVENLMWRPRHFAIKYHAQFDSVNFMKSFLKVQELKTGEVMAVQEACTRYGLTHIDITMAIHSNTYVWPTYQRFAKCVE